MSRLRKRILVCVMGICTNFASLHAFAQPAQGPQPTMKTPVVAGKQLDLAASAKAFQSHKVTLGGQAAFSAKQFVVASPARSAIKSRPFTVEEILAVAPKAKLRQEHGNSQVLVTGKGGRTHWVDIVSYVRGINAFESFLNSYGYSLRDGALETARRGEPGLVRKDLGLRFELLPAPGKGQPPKVDKAVRNYDLFFVPEEIVDPTGNPTLDQRSQPGYAIVDLPRGRGFVSPFAGSGAWRTSQVRRFRIAGIAAADLRTNAPAQGMAAMPAPAPGAPPPPAPDCGTKCTLKDGDYALSGLGQQIYDNVHLYNVWRCVTTPTQGTAVKSEDNPCTVGDTGIADNHAIKTDVHALDVYGSMFKGTVSYEQWKAHYKELCDMLAGLGEANFNQLYSKANPNAGEATSSGTETKTTGQIAGNFYDGKLDLKIVDIRDCLGQDSGNGWFSASLCATYGSDNHYAKATGFDVSDTAAINSHVTLFGLNFTLLDGTTAISWHQKGYVSKNPAQEAPPTVVEANEETTLNPASTSTTYDGPSAIVPIGPVPLTITSSLTTDLTIGEPGFIKQTPAYYFPVKGQDMLGVTFGAGAGVHVNFDAGVNAVVASAGIDGQLDLVKANANGGVTTTIDTGANTATVEKTYTLSGHALAGTLSAYVEVDLLLYSKRWSIELAHFDGVDLPGDETKLTYTANAIVPGTETVTCQ